MMTVLLEALAVLGLTFLIWRRWRHKPYVFFLFPFTGSACGAPYYEVTCGDVFTLANILGLFLGFHIGTCVMVLVWLMWLIYRWQSKRKGQTT